MNSTLDSQMLAQDLVEAVMDAARLKIEPGFVTLISPHEKRLMDKATQELASNLMSYTLAGDSIRAELDDSAIREGYGQDANTYPSVENTLKRVTDALRLSGLSSEDIRAVQGVVCAMMDPEPKTLVRGYYEDDDGGPGEFLIKGTPREAEYIMQVYLEYLEDAYNPVYPAGWPNSNTFLPLDYLDVRQAVREIGTFNDGQVLKADESHENRKHLKHDEGMTP